LALKRLISDTSPFRDSIDGRWVGDPVILASGWGGSDNLHDRAKSTFKNITLQVICDLCNCNETRDQLIEKAVEKDRFFISFIDALSTLRPELLREREFTNSLGTDWRRRYNRLIEDR
jgi:hypothetical protein